MIFYSLPKMNRQIAYDKQRYDFGSRSYLLTSCAFVLTPFSLLPLQVYLAPKAVLCREDPQKYRVDGLPTSF